MDYYKERIYEHVRHVRKRREIDLPSTEEILTFIIRVLGEGKRLTLAEIRRRIAEYYWLSDEDVYKTSEYGSIPILSSRVNAAIKRLLEALLIERVGTGSYQISSFGRQLLSNNPDFSEDDLWYIERRIVSKNESTEEDGEGIKPEVWMPHIEELPELQERHEEKPPTEEYYDLDYRDIEILYNSDLRFRNIVETGFVKYKDGSLYIAAPVWHTEDGYFEWFINKDIPETRLSIRKNYRYNMLQFMGFQGGKDLSKKEFYALVYGVYKTTPKWADTDDPGIMSVIYGFIMDIENADDGYAALRLFLKTNKVTQEELGFEIDLDERSIRRDLKGETPFDLDKLIRYLVGLKLPYDISKALIDKFDVADKDGNKYDPWNDDKHRFWEWLLKYGQAMTKEEINKKAEELGFEKIFKKIKHKSGHTET